MRSANQLLRLFIELVFILLGGFLLWIAWAGRFLFDPRRPSWLLLSALLIVWGLRTVLRSSFAGRKWRSIGRAAEQIGGASLAAAGIVLLSLVWAPFRWVDLLLGAAGTIFVLRGVISAALISRAP
jgi:hypothetical protein